VPVSRPSIASSASLRTSASMRSADGSLAQGAGSDAGACAASAGGASRLHAAMQSRIRRQAVVARRITEGPAWEAATLAQRAASDDTVGAPHGRDGHYR